MWQESLVIYKQGSLFSSLHLKSHFNLEFSNAFQRVGMTFTLCNTLLCQKSPVQKALKRYNCFVHFSLSLAFYNHA